MKFKLLTVLALVVLMCVAADTYGQGRGRGGGGGRPSNPGGGPPSGSGVDRGLGNAGSRSDGRSDSGQGNASSRSNGRSDDGISRARIASEKANRMSDTELNRYRGLSRKLGTTPEEMRARYEKALIENPDLTYGNFVAAHVIADNHGSRFPGITSSAILSRLASGQNLGQTLQDLGMTKEQSKTARRVADDKIKAARNRNR